MQSEVPLASLFNGKQHQPIEIAALVSHFLEIVHSRVVSQLAVRLSAIVLEQLYISYGVMLFVGQRPFTTDTPAVLKQDLEIFGGLLPKHCSTGPFASRNKAQARLRAEWLLSVLRKIGELLQQLLLPPSTAETSQADGERDTLGELAFQLCIQAPSCTRNVLVRLLTRCQRAELRGSRFSKRRASVLYAHERASVGFPPSHKRSSSIRRASRDGNVRLTNSMNRDSNVGANETLKEPPNFFATVEQALQLGRRFSIRRLLELQHSASRCMDDL